MALSRLSMTVTALSLLNGLVPLHDPKDVVTFHSGRWNTVTNPNLTFVSVGPDSLVPDRRILEKLPRPQHLPSLIVLPKLALPVPKKPVKRWNFRKANWSHYNTLTNKLAKSLECPLNSRYTWGSFPKSSHTKRFLKNGIHSFPAWRSA